MPLATLALMFGMAAQQTPPAVTCLRALRPLVAGEVAVRADFAVVACESVADGLSYDRSARVARLRRDLGEGEFVRGAPSTLSEVRPGQPLILETQVGPVAIERVVRVVRPARQGDRVTVRGSDGKAFSAPPPGQKVGS
jgi:hypothetical protein